MLGKKELRLQMEVRVLTIWFWNLGIILDYQDIPSIITSVLKSERKQKKVTVLQCEKESARHCWL
jgi:hypothetical protein